MQLWTRPLENPLRNLFTLFLAWKVLLLVIAACSPGPGYDTSTSLALTALNDPKPLPLILRYMVEKLTRWDGIYFVTTSHRGYLNEQEWAFGWGNSRLIALCTEGLNSFGVPRYQGLEGLVAILIAHVAHLFSVLLLFKLSLAIFGRTQQKIAFTAAALHIISPAGLFLSAPYAESSCAFLSFAGILNFKKSFPADGQATVFNDVFLMFSGIMFGAATTFRSNGILNGLLFLEEAFRVLFRLMNTFDAVTFRRLLATGVGGLLVGLGFFLPQYVAYDEYCGNGVSNPRPWCKNIIPSIYTFVQDHYWNCGIFRYWTVSNLPLFLLSAPVLSILAASGIWSMGFKIQRVFLVDKASRQAAKSNGIVYDSASQVLRNLGVSQLLLFVLTLITAHVQIITRISSAYPVWLWFIAILSRQGNRWVAGALIQFMVLYGIIQGGLFASFLPPA